SAILPDACRRVVITDCSGHEPRAHQHPRRPHRPEAQDVALSRPKHGFESRWGRQSRNPRTIYKLRRSYFSEFAAADFSAVAVFVAAVLSRSAFAVTARRTSVSRTW